MVAGGQAIELSAARAQQLLHLLAQEVLVRPERDLPPLELINELGERDAR